MPHNAKQRLSVRRCRPTPLLPKAHFVVRDLRLLGQTKTEPGMRVGRQATIRWFFAVPMTCCLRSDPPLRQSRARYPIDPFAEFERALESMKPQAPRNHQAERQRHLQRYVPLAWRMFVRFPHAGVLVRDRLPVPSLQTLRPRSPRFQRLRRQRLLPLQRH